MQQETEEIGFIIFGNPRGVFNLDEVEIAAKDAGIPSVFVHSIRTQSAFIRAAQLLAKSDSFKSDFRASVRDDENALTFAFVMQRPGVDKDSADFEVNALVKFNKKERFVEVLEVPPGISKEEVNAHAMRLFRQALGAWNCSDLHYMIKKYVSTHARQIGLRAGVSFLPSKASEAAHALQTFYTALNIPFFVLPVMPSVRNEENIRQAIVQDLKANMSRLAEEINTLAKKGTLTDRVSQARMAELQLSVIQYRDLAQSVHSDLSQIIFRAGAAAHALEFVNQPVDALISMLQRGEPVPEMICQLHASSPKGRDLMVVAAQVRAQDALPEIIDLEIKGESK